MNPKNETIKQVKCKLEQYSESPMYVTEQSFFTWWEQFNCAVFGNVLIPPSKLSIHKALYKNAAYGECIGYSDNLVEIRLQEHYSTTLLFATVLIHEMVHQWEWQIKQTMTHRKSFFMWKQPIYDSVGLTLSTYIEENKITNGY